MEAKASKHASKRVHACARARVCVRVRARGLGPAEDGSELRSHACGIAKVETRGRVPGVGCCSFWSQGLPARAAHKLHMARRRKHPLARMRGIAHVHIFFARWSADARAAAYAPGGAGHARALASFETRRFALPTAGLNCQTELCSEVHT
jgi:hypothetical protein